MKTLKFAPHLVPLILSGEKVSTWRLFDDKNLSVGDQLEFINKETGEKFGEAEIIAIKEKKLGEIEDSDYNGHEKFASKEQMIESYKQYYGDQVNLETIVKIIDYKML